MKQEGLLQPIVVRPLAENRFEVISGERRVRAAKLLGWQSIEAKILPPLSDAEAASKCLVENLQREDLDANERAEGVART